MKQSAFSLIELLVAVMIITVLCSIAASSYRDYIIRAQVAEGVQVIQECRKQIEANYQETDNFPTSAYGLSKGVQANINNSNVLIKMIYDYGIQGAVTAVWCSAYFNTSVVPSPGIIHVGATLSDSQNKLVWFCGRWNTSGWFNDAYMKYLPPECSNTSVYSALQGVT